MRRIELLRQHLSQTHNMGVAHCPRAASDNMPDALAASEVGAEGPPPTRATLSTRLPNNPPAYRPYEGVEQLAAATEFFNTYGFVVLEDCLSESELEHLNDWYERTQRAQPLDWGCQRGAHEEWLYHQPLLEHPELDGYVRHSSHFPLVATLLGGEEHASFSEFDFRETPSGTAQDRNWHRDIGLHGFGGAERSAREEYLASGAHSYICSFHYLTDVTRESPSFGVIPQSCAFLPTPGKGDSIKQLRAHMGAEYQELPLYCKAGTCVLYDISLYHSRVNASTGARTRRALQTYYSRDDVQPLTNWVILPQRLAEHPDPETARFYALQCGVQCQIDYAAGGYKHPQELSPEVQNQLRVGEHAYIKPDGEYSGT